MESVPVISFAPYSLEVDKPDPKAFQKLVDEVYHALTTVGFMCLTDVGVSAQLIEDVLASCNEFFNLTVEEKLKYMLISHQSGYHKFESEWIDHEIPYKDLKEAFVYTSDMPDHVFPNEVSSFKKSVLEVFGTMTVLQKRVLHVIAHSLGLEDKNYFADRHQFVGTGESYANLKINYYPPLGDRKVKDGQIRCGEHTDFGSITLLIQDMQGGLEVQTVDGKWIPATPLEGGIIVNIGDIMQRWTADRLVAGRHRVIVPADRTHRDKSRVSVAFFGNPDNDAMIECIDKSNKYPPIRCGDHVLKRLDDLYHSNPK